MEPTRLLLASTPKTGNAWVEALLSTLYDLPVVQIWGAWDGSAYRFDPTEADALGPRWIAHQHFPIQQGLTDWARDRRAHIVTTVRHPAATLVSLFHYVRNFPPQGAVDPLLLTHIPQLVSDRSLTMHDVAPALEMYVRERFFTVLMLSVAWIRSGASLVVRYEDLWQNPVRTLTEVTRQIAPVSSERIEQAIEQHELPVMRRSIGPSHQLFFRRGGDGGWREELPPAVIDVLRTRPPYPALFEELGYTLEAHEESPLRPARVSSAAPLEVSHFANGAPITAIIFACYMSRTRAQRRQWADVADVTPGTSFFAWLGARADGDPGAGIVPAITNLAAYLYDRRRDLQAVFPDVYGRDRVRYALWYCRTAPVEHGLDDVLIAPIRDGLRAWLLEAGSAPDEADAALAAEVSAVLFPYPVNLPALLDEKDACIASLQAVLGAREEELAAIKVVLGAREEEIATARAQLAMREGSRVTTRTS